MTRMGLFALSSKGDMAVVLDPSGFGRVEGTLARAALAGGPPRELAEGVLAADWSPDGSGLAIVKSNGGREVLEYPVGQTLYDPSPGHITHIRFSPSGDAIAALVHPVSGDTAGAVRAGRSGGPRAHALDGMEQRPRSRPGRRMAAKCGSPATRTGAAQAIHAVTRSGRERLLLAAPATLTLHDVSRDGRLLVSRDAWGASVMGATPSSPRERDFSWLDGSTAWDVSSDGTMLILEEAWEGGGSGALDLSAAHGWFTRGAARRRRAAGAVAGQAVGAVDAGQPATRWCCCRPEPGSRRTLPRGPIASYFPAARWLPDGRRFLVSANEAGKRPRVYLQSIDAGDPQPVTAEGAYGRLAVLADGEQFVTRGQDRRLAHVLDRRRRAEPLAGAEPTDLPIVASADGEWLYVQGGGDMPGEIARIHLRSGKREAVRSLLPPDPAGAMDILRIVMTPDARTYAYTFVRALSSLYLVDGLH